MHGIGRLMGVTPGCVTSHYSISISKYLRCFSFSQYSKPYKCYILINCVLMTMSECARE